MTRTTCIIVSLVALVPLGLSGACGSDIANVVSDPTAGTGAAGTGGDGIGGLGTGGGSTSSGGYNTGGIAMPTDLAECQGHIYECGDLVDNDMDGLTDSQDPDCLGPCDDTEDSYFGGIPGQSGPPCDVDCYFDQDSGHGNDDCYWDHRCDPLSIEPNYYPEPWLGDMCAYLGPDHEVTPVHKTCATLLSSNGQSEACLDYCLPLTPNGCDCFGCCELPADSGEFVWLGSEGLQSSNFTVCTQAEAANPDFCHPCTPVVDCVNECEHCELCVGKPVLPPDCLPGNQCAPGIQPCGLPGEDPCPPGFFCITGCCQAVPT